MQNVMRLTEEHRKPPTGITDRENYFRYYRHYDFGIRFRSKCRHSRSLLLRVGSKADKNDFGQTFLFHSRCRYREPLFSNDFRDEFGQTVLTI